MAGKPDYKKLGFMCGLEIHQRLATRHKLFCNCLANMDSGAQIGKLLRRQRAVAGELGVIDLSSSFESGKARGFVYDLFNSSTCLVDSDEEPPHSPNVEAIGASLGIAYALNTTVPDEIEVMRKSVVDGSDPSAFQRTMLIGHSGSLVVGRKQIPITSIFLEEESSGIVSSNESSVEYSLDRLAIPLVEIDTDPVIESPEEAKAVAMAIGLLLRLTGKAQRGIGSIRQDVNVSIKEGARVEIKGFQELDVMDTIIEAEINRQLALIEIKKELLKRDAYVGRPVEVKHVFSKTNAKIIHDQLSAGGTVIAAKLKGFKGLVGKEIGSDLRLGSEISDYAKGGGVRGIIHGDEEMSNYGISKEEILSLSHLLGLGLEDSFMMVAEKKEKAENSIKLAIRRAEMSLHDLPSETRGVDSKRLTTRFLRPIPGKSRMYPETDILPISAEEIIKMEKPQKVDVEFVKNILHKEIDNPQLAEQMLWSRELPLYRKIVDATGAQPSVVSSILLEKMRELSRNGIEVNTITESAMLEIFREFKRGAITKSAIGEILSGTPKSAAEVKEIIRARKLRRITGNELAEIVAQHRSKDKGSAMREIMLKYRLNVDGEELGKLL